MISKTALVVLKGSPPSRELLDEFLPLAGTVICADGAASVMQRYNVRPDVIIGDCDSITEEILNEFDSSTLHKIEEQETTDGEKTLNYCLENGWNRVIVLGAFGGRIDHSLYNLELLKKYHRPELKIRMINEREELFLIAGRTVIQGKKGRRISIMPVYGAVNNVTTKGLAWNLERCRLNFGGFSSISNRFEATEAVIEADEGELLVIIERENR